PKRQNVSGTFLESPRYGTTATNQIRELAQSWFWHSEVSFRDPFVGLKQCIAKACANVTEIYVDVATIVRGEIPCIQGEKSLDNRPHCRNICLVNQEYLMRGRETL